MRLKALMLTVLFSSAVLQAQTDFRPGYVIELSGDTLFGEVDYRGDLMMGDSCRIRISKEDIRTYYPGQIAGYRFTDGKYYVSRQVEGRYAFLEYLINGRINIFYVRENDGDRYYIEKEGEGIILLPYETGTKQVDKNIYDNNYDQSSLVSYESTRHIGLLKYYMQDYPDILDKVDNLDKPTHNNLINLAEEYHNGVCFDRSCIIYEKQLPRVSISVEPYFSQGFFSSEFYYSNSNSRGFGGNIYISMPRASEKIFFKTGYSYSESILVGSEKYIYYKVPLQFQYMFTAHKFVPKVSYGANYWSVINPRGIKENFHTWELNVGANYNITKFMALSLGLGAEFPPYMSYGSWEAFIPVYGSINFGLFFKL